MAGEGEKGRACSSFYCSKGCSTLSVPFFTLMQLHRNKGHTKLGCVRGSNPRPFSLAQVISRVSSDSGSSLKKGSKGYPLHYYPVSLHYLEQHNSAHILINEVLLHRPSDLLSDAMRNVSILKVS